MTVEIVELALPDGPLMLNELQDPYITKIGGRPSWPFSFETLSSLGLPRDSLKCKSCGSVLFLVLQMDCPWTGEEKYFDRVMYVFGCNSRVCTETQGEMAWKAFIIQRPSDNAPFQRTEPKKVALWDSIMLGSAATAVTETLESDIRNLNINEEDPVYDKLYPVGFPPQRLHICEEMIRERTKSTASKPEETVPAAFSVSPDEEWNGEAYESQHPMGIDKSFLTFQRRISSYPRQCVRFSPAGQPLFFCNAELKPNPGTCDKCGQRRVFELQLMPAILSLLPTNDERHLEHIVKEKRGQHPLFGDGMEWGTVIIFTCGTCTRSNDTLLIEASIFSQIETI